MAVITRMNGSEGNDVLTVSKNGYNYVTGLEGDDTYVINNIKKSWTVVDDALQNYADMDDIFDDTYAAYPIANAGNDTVQIINVNANDLILFFDVGTESAEEVDESLAIVHKSSMDSVMNQIKKYNEGILPSKGCVEIDYYFGNNSAYNGYEENSAVDDDGNPIYHNQIEHIQVSKGGVTKELNIEKYISDVREKVEAVLVEYGYSTAMEMLFESKASTKQKNKLKACYKTAFDLIITGTGANDKIYAEAGSDTIVFNAESGNDTVYNATSADTLNFEGVTVSFLEKNGNNLSLYYGENNKVTLSNYYKAKDKLNTYADTKGEHNISDQTIMVTGSGKIEGTEGNDIIKGGSKADKIYGKGGNDELYGGLGNDVIYSQSQEGNTVLLAGEEGNDKLYAGAGTDIFYFGEAYDKGEGKDTIYNANSGDKLRFVHIKFDDLKFTKSGNNLVITIAKMNNLSDDAQAAYKNFQVTLSNYFKNSDKLNTIEFGIVDSEGNYVVVDTKSILDEAVFYVSGSGKIAATDYDEIITGGKKADKITTGAGDDVITAGKGNDTITLGAGNKTLVFQNGDGNDTINLGSSDSVKINLEKCDSIDYIKGQGKAVDDLYIERKYTDVKGKVKTETITIKNYFTSTNPNVEVISDGKTQNLADVIFTVKASAKGGELQGTEGDDILRGSDKVDTIYANGGNDTIIAAKGNDIIHAEDTTCTINLNELDGVDTIYANSNSNIVLNYMYTEEEIRFFRSSDNNHLDLIIARGDDFSKDIIRIKDYYAGSDYQPKPSISYQFNDGDITNISKDDLMDVSSVYAENVLGYFREYNYVANKPCKIVTVDDNGFTFITDGGSTISSKESNTNDTFIVNNLSKSTTYIEDSSGFDDTLQINGANSEAGINVFFDVNANYGFSDGITTSDLFIVSSGSKTSSLSVLNDCVNKFMMSSKGIGINDYFGEKRTGIPSSSGLIENVKVADVNGDNVETIDMQTKVYVIARKVQEYIQSLDNPRIQSASDILRYGNSTQKNALYKIYSKTDVAKELKNGYEFNSANRLIRNGISISGGSNEDTFIINNSTTFLRRYEDITLNGGEGNDLYDINSVNAIDGNGYYNDAQIYNLNINDISGDDTYILGDSLYYSGTNEGIKGDTSYYITDCDGNDNYLVSGGLLDKVETVIDDKSGENTLEIKGGWTSKNMTVLFDVILDDSAEGGFRIGNDLRIVSPNSTGGDFVYGNNLYGIRIKDCFSDENTGTMSIKAGDEYLSQSSINEIASDIASWMRGNDYSSGVSSFDILRESNDNESNYGHPETLIKTYYNNVDWQSSETTIN